MGPPAGFCMGPSAGPGAGGPRPGLRTVTEGDTGGRQVALLGTIREKLAFSDGPTQLVSSTEHFLCALSFPGIGTFREQTGAGKMLPRLKFLVCIDI